MQQEGLQYNGEAAWGKVIVIYFISAVLESSEETQACFSEEVLTSLFIIFLLRSYVRTSLLVSSSLQTSFGVSVTL